MESPKNDGTPPLSAAPAAVPGLSPASREQARETFLAGGVFLAALGLRLAVWAAWKGDPLAVRPMLDAEFYHDLASGRFQADAGPYLWNPLYPAFLKAVYGIFGEPRPSVALLVQAGLGALGAELAYLAARRWFEGRAPALVCAALAALYAPFLVYEGLLLGASLAVFLVWGFLWLSASVDRARVPLLWALPGAALGAAGTAEPTLLAASLPLALWLALRRGGRGPADGASPPAAAGAAAPAAGPGPGSAPLNAPAGGAPLPVATAPGPGGGRRLLRPAALLLGVAAALLPPFVHNARAGVYSPLPRHGGINFYIGNRSGASGRYEKAFAGPHGLFRQRELARAEASRRTGAPLDWSGADAYWLRLGFEEASGDWAGWLALLGRKALLLHNACEVPLDYNVDFLRGRMRPLSIPLPGFALVFPLAAAGAVFALRGRKMPWAAALLLVSGGAAVALFFVSSRYRLPLLPPLILLAGFGAVEAVRSLASARLTGLALGAAAAAAAAFLAFLPAEKSDFSGSWRMLGDAQAEQGALFDALASYERSVEERPTSAAWNNKGTALLRLSKTRDAAEAFRKAIALEEGNREAWNNLGVALKKSGDFFEAEETFEEAIDRFPGYAKPMENLARMYDEQGLHDQARELRRALRGGD